MEKNQIDQYDMLLSTENHFDDNTAIWTTNVPIATAKTLFTSKIKAIGEQYAIQLLNTAGVTETKDANRQILEEQAFIIAAAVSGYANAVGKKDLYRVTNFTKSDLVHFRDATLLGECVNINREAGNEIANLAPYGVLPATLTAFGTAMTNFSTSMKNPTGAIGRRKEATDKLAILIPDAIEFLNMRMDKLVVALTATQPAFVGIYNNVRAINSSPTNTISLTTTCINSVTTLPIQKVKLSIVGENLDRVSNESGSNVFQNIPEGTHTLVATLGGYNDYTIDFVVVSGLTTELAISMIPII
jgi:hypothetical protein